MWSSKMAARWRGEDGDLNADNSAFLPGNTPTELNLSRGVAEGVEMDTQSCAHHSILSIFEDSAVTSEGKSGVEDESETLLSALTEMLDSVGDDDGTLSPFDMLPDTQLLTHLECRDNPVVIALADRPRPRPKPPAVVLTSKRDGEKEDDHKMERNSLPQLFTQQSPTLFHSKTKAAENEVEVFTSTSLVNLVRLMHPYCLKLHVEEGDKLRRNHALFSQEEVWRYEKPTEESDEEINVVSDDEEPARETKGKEEGDEKREDGKPLKSVLLNGNSPRAPPSREKKRVSFGPVQVASLSQSVEKGLNEKDLSSEAVSVPLNNTKALGKPAGPALEPQNAPSSESAALPPKGETKAKSLSLQQYRQLRQKRQPLVEKQGNYTTKWPSVPEAPKELPPILCLQGQRHNSCGPKTAHHYPDCTRISGHKTPSHRASLPPRPRPSEAKPSAHLRCSGSKRPRAESKTTSPASPLPDVPTNPNVILLESRKPPLLSSDPPNPVLVPLPVSQPPSPATAHSPSEPRGEFLNTDSNPQCSTHVENPPNESSAAFLQRQPSASEPKPPVLSVHQDGTTLLQGIKNKLTQTASGVAPRPPALCPASECNKPRPQESSLSPAQATELEPKTPQSPGPDPAGRTRCPSSTPPSAQPPSPPDAPVLMEKQLLPEVPPSAPSPPPPTPQDGCRAQSASSGSGIEAPDLTSLLEQFEETQAQEERVCEDEPSLTSATQPSNPPTHGPVQLDRRQPEGSGETSRLPLTPSPEAPEPLSVSETQRRPGTLRNLPDLRTSERVDIPEPLGTEIILSTRQEQPARRKTPPSSKAIQIIAPRPLPSKKTHVSAPEAAAAAHTPPHVYSSISSDHDYCGAEDHSLASAAERSRAKPSLLEDVSKTANELQATALDSSAAVQRKTQQTWAGPTKSTPQPGTGSEVNPSTDRGLGSSACGAGGEDKTGPCTPPTPPPSPPARGRQKRRSRRGSPHSDSSSSSRCSSCSSCSSRSSSSSSGSRSPKRQKLHHQRSESSSCPSSPCRSISRSPPRRYRLSYSRSRCSRSRSRSWSQSRSPSRSRSPSPRLCQRPWRDVYSSRESRKLRREHEMRIQKLKAIDERRVVYVGRIRRSMTHDELRERFTQFGEVECVSLHFRDRGDHYGFVTFYNMEDAFAAIDNGGKVRKPDELPFDICFGGRRQFCNSNYSDLDANRDASSSPVKNRLEDLDFDSLLKQAQRGLKR